MLKVASNSPASCALAGSPIRASQILYHFKKYQFFSQEVKDLINLKILMSYGRILVAHCGSSLQSNFSSAPFLSVLTLQRFQGSRDCPWLTFHKVKEARYLRPQKPATWLHLTALYPQIFRFLAGEKQSSSSSAVGTTHHWSAANKHWNSLGKGNNVFWCKKSHYNFSKGTAERG